MVFLDFMTYQEQSNHLSIIQMRADVETLQSQVVDRGPSGFQDIGRDLGRDMGRELPSRPHEGKGDTFGLLEVSR